MGLKLGIHGVSGRMGLSVLQCAMADKEIQYIVGFSRRPLISEGKLSYEHSLEKFVKRSDVIIDFSSDEGLYELLLMAQKFNKPLVIGTTALSISCFDQMKKASDQIPLIYAANFSLGVAACLQAIEYLSNHLKTKFQIKIIETHHKHKKDSPSGTALAFAQATGSKPIIESFREGEIVGKHQIFFSSPEEKIEICHEAFSRETFAQGAIFAAKKIPLQANGFYNLRELLDQEFQTKQTS
ncbi:MAG: 4-hydroxy-tetrahydrodipicolinate reductase [Chlamydiae bacterium]|nr:4-hydroxy-tetrahydrodipicolinate reductase [Chlamydiota bacterium]